MNQTILISNIKASIISNNLYCIVPYTKFNIKILERLIKDGYLYSYSLIYNKKKQFKIKIKFKYFHNKSVLQYIKIISKPGKRVYWNLKQISKYLSSKQNVKLIISSNKGIINSDQALNEKISGEILMEYY